MPTLRSKTVRRQPVFELVAAKCNWHLALKWVRVLRCGKIKAPLAGDASNLVAEAGLEPTTSGL